MSGIRNPEIIFCEKLKATVILMGVESWSNMDILMIVLGISSSIYFESIDELINST